MVTTALHRPTLVLNRNWQPVGVATVARALVKVFNDTARVVDPADYQVYRWEDWRTQVPQTNELFISTSRLQRLRLPEVVTLTKYDRVPANSVAFSRRNIFKRDRFTCQYCGRQGRSDHSLSSNDAKSAGTVGEPTQTNRHRRPGSEELTIDHVVPRAQGGVSSWENCVLACVECNSRKADRTPAQAKMTLHKQPSRPHWKPLYAAHGTRVDSWSKFISEAYWNVELEN